MSVFKYFLPISSTYSLRLMYAHIMFTSSHVCTYKIICTLIKVHAIRVHLPLRFRAIAEKLKSTFLVVLKNERVHRNVISDASKIAGILVYSSRTLAGFVIFENVEQWLVLIMKLGHWSALNSPLFRIKRICGEVQFKISSLFISIDFDTLIRVWVTNLFHFITHS